MTSENLVVVILPFVKQSLKENRTEIIAKEDILEGKEKVIYNIILQNPMIKRVDIQGRIHLEKSQTIEIINKLRESGRIVKVGNGPATGHKVLE